MRLLINVCVAFATVVGPAFHVAARGAEPSPSAERPDRARYVRVVENAIGFLDAGGAKLEKNASCINCHHDPLRAWAMREGIRIGLTVDATKVDEATQAQWQKLHKLKDDYRDKQWGHSLAAWYVLGSVDTKVEASREQGAELVRLIVAEQGKEGSWKAAGQFANQRRPKKDADEVQTLWSLLALSRVDANDEIRAARDKAVAWLKTSPRGDTVDARALRLLAEHRWGDPAEARQLAKSFLATQHSDGGWGWQADDPADAWGTGMALYVLSELDELAPPPALERARSFLATTQKEDGSWLVEGKLTKKPEMASYFGTAWAIVGLGRSLPAK